jgi:hypothetical protein
MEHHPHGGGSPHCDNDKLEQFIASYQTQGDAESPSEIIRLTQKRALTLIRFNGTARYCTESELLSDVNYKLLKAVGRFDLRSRSFRMSYRRRFAPPYQTRVEIRADMSS